MRRPITSTYRLQLRGPHADPDGRAFGFAEAAREVPYLRDLGVSHLYLSPIFTAVPDSNHNYDVVDPTTVNPELGGIEGLRELARVAHESGLGLILDIVPNHLGVENPRMNRWFWDVLKHGRDSEFECYFDIDWHEDNGAGGKMGMPVLAKEGDEDKLELVHLSAEAFPEGAAPDGEVVLKYFDSYFPVMPGSFASLDDDVLDVYQRQPYKLMYWRDGVNSYRRFFSVNGLAGVRQEDPLVFERTHRLLRQLIGEDLIDGVRVDHPDGLADPFDYLTRLRDLIGPDRWLVVEKILEVTEPLDPRLQVDGTTGYDAMRELDGVFVNQSAEDALSVLAMQHTGSTWDEAALHAAEPQLKRRVATYELAAEVRRLARAIRRDNFSTAGNDVSDEDLIDTVVELMSAIPVYRADYRSLSRILSTVIAEMAVAQPDRVDALNLISAAMLARGEAETRFAQVSGAVMAKGVEDTLYYRASRLVALQEVGGAPGRFGVGAAEFHLLQQERAHLWPKAMTSLTTHDTKRSEDTRARMLEISEVDAAFGELTRSVFALVPPPDTFTGHFLLQNVLGIWPADGNFSDSLRSRLHEYALKAIREAGVNTTWLDREDDYESAIVAWIDALIDGPATADIARVAHDLHRGGVVVSLGRKALQLAGAGVADTYQGQELFDYSLVDPDNRRFVDYSERAHILASYREARADDDFDAAAFIGDVTSPEGADRAKLLTTTEGLHLRLEYPALFTAGDHQAVFAVGEAHDCLIGLARGDAAGPSVIALATRTPLGLEARGGWGNTTVRLPEGEWTDRFTGKVYTGCTDVADLFEVLPTALLVSSQLTQTGRV